MQKQPTDVDRHIGARIHARRTVLAISQEKLADSLGITFQQVQKYEKGVNRVTASRLLQIARILQVEVEFFFDGLQDASSRSDPILSTFYEVMTSTEGVRLLSAFAEIDDIDVQRKVVDLVETVLKLKTKCSS
ncbi:helix-turn-helix domain-containing protein [Microvirga sp. 2YAF29]|uniref:helix-turn-helix domain-containing protein n=1 Tax=Microvirga sp. 2YAF29 TaxID=3233031 RepID=UPI003F9B3188